MHFSLQNSDNTFGNISYLIQSQHDYSLVSYVTRYTVEWVDNIGKLGSSFLGNLGIRGGKFWKLENLTPFL